jgi:hypothetical protein
MPSSGEITWTMPWSGLATSNSVIPAASHAARVSVMNAWPPGISVASVRPGLVSTMWSVTANTRAESRSVRPISAMRFNAEAPVRSWRNTRSMAMRSAPPGAPVTRWRFQILSRRVSAMGGI